MSAVFTLLHADPEHQILHQKNAYIPLVLGMALSASADFCASKHVIQIQTNSCLSFKARVNVKLQVNVKHSRFSFISITNTKGLFHIQVHPPLLFTEKCRQSFLIPLDYFHTMSKIRLWKQGNVCL